MEINMTAVTEYVCNKYYHIEYKTENRLMEGVAKGLLLNYASGNVVLLSEEGIYHIKYKDIIFMKPILNITDKLTKPFIEIGIVADEVSSNIIELAKAVRPVTRADKIRSMTDEELAELIGNAKYKGSMVDMDDICGKGTRCPEDKNCVKCILNWLRQEEKI